MKKRFLRLTTLLITLISIATQLSGCEALKEKFRSPKYNEVKSVVIDADSATVLYENGFQFNVSNISERIACY